MSHIRNKTISGLKAGDVFTITRSFSRGETQAFGHLTRDYNPVHYEEDFARGKGMKGLIAHGLLTGGMLCEIGGQMAWLATGMNFKFKGPVYFGDEITLTFTLTQVEENGFAKAEAVFSNQHGREVICGELLGYLPKGGDVEVLKKMVDEGDPTNPLA